MFPIGHAIGSAFAKGGGAKKGGSVLGGGLMKKPRGPMLDRNVPMGGGGRKLAGRRGRRDGAAARTDRAADRDERAGVDRDRQHGTAVVVGVLAEQVDAAGRGGDDGGRRPERRAEQIRGGFRARRRHGAGAPASRSAVRAAW